jgi:hypothetical protein
MDARYAIVWTTDHSCGELPNSFRTKKKAIKEAREWKRQMIAIDHDKKEARREYQWEIILRD